MQAVIPKKQILKYCSDTECILQATHDYVVIYDIRFSKNILLKLNTQTV